jgi:seryl-tRNA synthetase
MKMPRLQPFTVKDGVYALDAEWSHREREILHSCVDFLISRGFQFLQIPSSVRSETIDRQQVTKPDGTPISGLRVGDTAFCLSGSAEQGILERLAGRHLDEMQRIVAHNGCFRTESRYEGLIRVREFSKVEQYMCVPSDPDEQQDAFNEILQNALDFLDRLGLSKRRIVEQTRLDAGYHLKKWDIEVHTKAYGWMETHSCSLFGTEQADRYGITGPYRHTLSNTGIASPRILIPLMEREGIGVR